MSEMFQRNTQKRRLLITQILYGLEMLLIFHLKHLVVDIVKHEGLMK